MKGLTEVTVEKGSMAGMVVRGSTEVVEAEGMEEMEVTLNLCVHARKKNAKKWTRRLSTINFYECIDYKKEKIMTLQVIISVLSFLYFSKR